MCLHRDPQRNLTRTVWYFFGKEVKDRPSVRTLNVVFVDIKTNCKPTENFRLMHTLPRATPRGVKRRFIKGEAIRLLRTNSLKQKTFEECMRILNDASKPEGILNKIDIT